MGASGYQTMGWHRVQGWLMTGRKQTARSAQIRHTNHQDFPSEEGVRQVYRHNSALAGAGEKAKDVITPILVAVWEKDT